MSDDVRLRPYDPDRDPHDLWDLKRGFELGLGSGTGGEDKQAVYEGKLTDEYGERYLDWVFWCTKHDPRCVTVAEVRDDANEAGGESNQNSSESNQKRAKETERNL